MYLALAISGSMGGAPIEAAKQAVAEFALQALALPALADLQLFLYDDKVQHLELTGCDEVVLRAQVGAAGAGGGSGGWLEMQSAPAAARSPVLNLEQSPQHVHLAE